MGKIIIIDISYANCNLSIKYQTESQNCTKQSYCKKIWTSSPSPQTKQDRIHIGACKWMHLFRNCEEGRSSSASGGYSDKQRLLGCQTSDKFARAGEGGTCHSTPVLAYFNSKLCRVTQYGGRGEGVAQSLLIY